MAAALSLGLLESVLGLGTGLPRISASAFDTERAALDWAAAVNEHSGKWKGWVAPNPSDCERKLARAFRRSGVKGASEL